MISDCEMMRSGETMGATHVQNLQDFPNHMQYTDKFQMNRLFVAHVQCTLNLVSGGRGTLKFAVPSTQCVVYLLRNLWSKFG